MSYLEAREGEAEDDADSRSGRDNMTEITKPHNMQKTVTIDD